MSTSRILRTSFSQVFHAPGLDKNFGGGKLSMIGSGSMGGGGRYAELVDGATASTKSTGVIKSLLITG